jgi:zinc/manganese transport system permease protein
VLLGKRFFELSNQKCLGEEDLSPRDRFLNLLFYITFGVVVVKSVLVGGIFLVFTLLIAPAVASALFIHSWKGRLLWAWIIGLVGTVSGIVISYSLNISNGPAIVCVLGLLAFVLAFTRLLRPLQT